jgi:hypothetical protein
MQTFQRSRNQQGNAPGISTATVVALVLLVIALTTVVTLYGQALAENGALNNGTVSKDLTAARQVDKLNAEIQKIRSETAGSRLSPEEWCRSSACCSAGTS